jgi:hypothetical protein
MNWSNHQKLHAEQMSSMMKSKWEDPEFRQYMSTTHYDNTLGKWRQSLTQEEWFEIYKNFVTWGDERRLTISSMMKNEGKDWFNSRMFNGIKSSILQYIRDLIEHNLCNESDYNSHRPHKLMPRWENLPDILNMSMDLILKDSSELKTYSGKTPVVTKFPDQGGGSRFKHLFSSDDEISVNFRNHHSKVHRDMITKLNSDEEFKTKSRKGRIFNMFEFLMEKSDLDSIYNACKSNDVRILNVALKKHGYGKRGTSYKLINNYFSGDMMNAYNEFFSTYNHQVIAVERVDSHVDQSFYDIEVEGYHNFAITDDSRNGVFVHNSIVYGKSIANFARDFMKGDVKGAADLFNILYERFPRIRPYIEERHKEIKELGYCKSMFGDIMRFFNPASLSSISPKMMAEFERQSVNYPIQGTASHVGALAIYDLSAELGRVGIRSFQNGFTHDAVDNEFDATKFFKFTDTLRYVMVDKVREETKIPVDVEWEVGVNLYDMISLEEVHRDEHSRTYKFKSRESSFDNIKRRLDKMFITEVKIDKHEDKLISYKDLFTPKTPYSSDIGRLVRFVSGTVTLREIV